jgi:hypothetical protein
MTPDQLISTMHRQRTELAAMRLAMTDLGHLLAPEVREQWLQALQSRTEKARATAHTYPRETQDALLAMANSLELLHKALAMPPEPK